MPQTLWTGGYTCVTAMAVDLFVGLWFIDGYLSLLLFVVFLRLRISYQFAITMQLTITCYRPMHAVVITNVNYTDYVKKNSGFTRVNS